VRRGKGEPVHCGRGVDTTGGVKTALGAADLSAGLKGVGETSGPRAGIVTSNRRAAGS